MAQVLAAMLPVQLPENAAEKAKGHGPNACALVTHVGDLDGIPGSKFQPGPVVAVGTIWGVK